ncbi:MAG TPA: dTMP kinase [Gemmatimonadales bacterium]|nr:dTMP kinase [Gemmatimonadales bacterium]
MTAGFFIAVEGPDGAGKTTLAGALAGRMREAGIEPVLVRQPGGTPAAERIREAFLDPAVHFEPHTELLYICAARAHLVQEVIRPALAAGRVVISDRYELSTHAYQGAGRGVDRQTVALVNEVATGGLRPHLTLVLDIPAELGLARQQTSGKLGDRLERADLAFHRRVAAEYLAAAGEGVRHFDGRASPDQLLDAAWAAVAAAAPERFGATAGNPEAV